MDKQKERLIDFAKTKGLSQRQLEVALGLSSGTISHSVSGLSQKVIAKVTATFPELNIVWLLTGEGDKIRPSDDTVNNAYATEGSAAAVYGNASVSSGAEEVLKAEIERLRSEIKELKDEKAKLYALLMKK